MGWLARKYGLQANAVTALELVTADGSLVRADAEHHPDLFWALRGGGGNFGVVTAIEFAVHPVDELYAGAMFFPFERASEVLHTWSALLPTLPDELMSWASLMHFPPIPDVPAFARGRSFAVVMGAFLGSEAEGRELLRPLRRLGPARDTFATVPPVVLGDLAMDPLDPLPFHLAHQLLDGLPAETIDELIAKVGPGSGRGPTVTMLQFRHMGGALAREAPGAGARATLPGEICMVALGVVIDEASDAAVRSALADVDGGRPAASRRRLPELRRGAGRREHASSSPHVWARLRRSQGALRPGRPVRRQPPHPPAGRGGPGVAVRRGPALRCPVSVRQTRRRGRSSEAALVSPCGCEAHGRAPPAALQTRVGPIASPRGGAPATGGTRVRCVGVSSPAISRGASEAWLLRFAKAIASTERRHSAARAERLAALVVAAVERAIVLSATRPRLKVGRPARRRDRQRACPGPLASRRCPCRTAWTSTTPSCGRIACPVPPPGGCSIGP